MDSSPPTDDTMLRAGLTIRWDSKPGTIPGSGPGDTKIDRAVFNLASFRIVADTGPLTLAPVTLTWEAQVKPGDVVINDAPSGIYSRSLFDLAPMSGGQYAYEIEGEVDINDEDRDFVIRDTVPIGISVDYSVNLPPGGNMVIPIEIDIGKIVGAVSFSNVPYQNQRYTIDSTSSELPKVRMVLDDAIDFDDSN